MQAINISGIKRMKYKFLYLHLIIFVISFVAVISRRPDAIFNPQFWAEDGNVFYSQAYNNGIFNSLFSPYAGYLHIIPRLTAAFSMLFPLKLAPLIFNLTAITIQIVPVNLLFSSRFSKLIPNINNRIYISLLYLSLPGCYEVHANITNSQWHVALLIFMAIIAKPYKFWTNLYDLAIILLGGLTGPFSVLLIPSILFLIIFDKSKNKKSRINTFFYIKILILASTAITQFFYITKFGHGRISRLGSISLSFDDIGTLLEILTNQLFSMSIFGTHITNYLFKVLPASLHIIFFNVTLLIGGTITLFYLLIKSSLELRAFIIFAFLIPFIAIALEFPNIGIFEYIGVGGRYWFNLILAFSLGIVWLCQTLYRKESHVAKFFAVIILVTMSIGRLSDWQHPAFTDFEFAKYADRFAESPLGHEIIIPTNPYPWSIKLIKH